ncbi:MAG TPA: NAD(P)-dependent oxidoreductase [Rhizomicrobium sp.]|nr:NAD(P)-dependent oxidoreductase [Rhizomicrobium sp.]
MTLGVVPTSPLRIGVIGIGAFGSRAALRLLWSGFHHLMVYDTHEQTPRFFTGDHGGLSMGSPTMLAQQSDIIITALPSAAEMRRAFFGWEGLAKYPNKKNSVILDIGTTDPMETAAMAKELEAAGFPLVDAPAFGTPQDAKEGKLTMVVGGTDEAVERCRPILDTLAARVIRAGATGSAQAAAAIADYVRAVRLLAASEAIRLGRQFGFEPGNLLEVCDALGGAALPQMLKDEVATRRFRTGLQLGVIHANVALAEKMNRDAGLGLPLLPATENLLTKAEERLGYSMDHSALIKWLETLAAPPEEAQAAAEPPAGTETKTGSA